MNKENTKVLVVDDDVNVTKSFTRIFQKKGYETDNATTGEEAILKAKAKFYDVTLIDIRLGDMNGNELLSKLDSHGRNMIKIILTGSVTTEPVDIEKADAYLLKPVNPQDLLSIIEKKIEK